MKHFKNFTPHSVKVIIAQGETISLPSEGSARAVSMTTQVGMIYGIQVVEEQLGAPEWPEGYTPQAGDSLIVSRVFAEAVRKNGVKLPADCHLYCPGSLVRDKDGNIVGCESLVRLI